MNPTRIVIATPHPRHDELERRLRAETWLDVRRVRDRQSLSPQLMREFDPTYIFFPHWSWKIPAEIFEPFTCVIFHMTDLPFGRGGSPLQNLIVRGIRTTQLSALRCVAELDAGPIYLKRPLSLEGTAEEILQRAAEETGRMILEITRDRPVPAPQEGPVVEFRRRTPADGDLAGVAGLDAVYDHIRMLDADGYPPAFVQVGKLRFEFSAADLREGAVHAQVRITERNE